jgi:hypothetical protein
MHFQLPTWDFLDKAFIGGEAWLARQDLPPRPPGDAGAPSEVGIDKPDKTFDGFTLCTTTESSSAVLLDMRGNVVHRWQMPFRQAWPKAPHVPSPQPDERIHWFRCHLYANGDLLAIYHAEQDTPYGYGLVKLDKESNLLWAYGGNVHHDVDAGEDGRIYALTQKIVRTPPAGLEDIPAPFIADYVVVLSPEGQELHCIPLLEAFRDSPFALTLATLSRRPPKARLQPAGPPVRPEHGDILHANSVKVLPRAQAPQFPLFKAGQVLISLRTLDTLAVLDVESRSVVWAASGLWRSQHDAQFLDNGHLLLYDNRGTATQARVLEYDPVTGAYPWSYVDNALKGFVANQRGATQRLPNGNTLIVDPDDYRLFEVTPRQEVVWECSAPISPYAQGPMPLYHVSITSARRYAAAELTFLKGGARARP